MVLLIGLVFGGGDIVDTSSQIEPITKENTSAPAATPTATLTPTPTETAYPKPSYTPTLRPYLIDKTHDIWHARDPTSYITPDNEWVKHYASQLYIDIDGRFRYKNQKVPLVEDLKGNIVEWVDKPLLNNYTTDMSQYPNFDGDMWVMPDYYSVNGMKDDCDGWGIAVTSMLLSGEMSVKTNNGFVKQTIPAKAVLGYATGLRDMWVEYKVDGITYITSAAKSSGFTLFFPFESGDRKYYYPVFEFDNKNFGRYKEW